MGKSQGTMEPEGQRGSPRGTPAGPPLVKYLAGGARLIEVVDMMRLFRPFSSYQDSRFPGRLTSFKVLLDCFYHDLPQDRSLCDSQGFELSVTGE